MSLFIRLPDWGLFALAAVCFCGALSLMTVAVVGFSGL